jgi:4-amino-4-deoxy-L-arabinose transferase-like glycosyltransferase
VLNSALVEFVDSAQVSPPDAPKLSLSAQIVWAVLIIATLYVCYFSHLGAIGFVGPDEPRYAWIARDIAETGDWVTPRLYGKPWFEKPPLYYWCAALSFKIFGVSEAAARLPSAIAALLATLALAWLALRLYGAETARWLLLLLPTSVGMIGFSHAASTDMLFSATLTLALVATTVLLRVTEPTSVVVAQHAAPGAFLFGLFLGLAVLAKGPAALVLLGGAAFSWVIFTKRWRDAFRLFHPVAIVAFCLTALPWYVLCARRNPEFFRIFIIEHNFKRYLTPEFQHIQPFWYYAAVLLIALLPWTALLLWSALTGAIRLWRTRTINPATCLLLCWAGFCLLFFSISKSKLPGYILPTIPPIVLLAAAALARRLGARGAGGRLPGAVAASTLLCLSVAGFAYSDKLLFAIDYFPPQPLGWGLATALLLSITGLAFSFFRRGTTAIVLSLVAVLLVQETATRGDAGLALDLRLSARWAAKPLQEASNKSWLPYAFSYKLRRSDVYALSFYLHRELLEWPGDTMRPAWVFAPSGELGAMRQRYLECPYYFIAYPTVIACRSAGFTD